jgi:hypothetical protein
MSRIEPIRPSRALVRLVREGAEEDARRESEDRAAARPRLIRPSTLLKPELGDATASTAFEIHRLTGGAPRGLKADLGVRRLWIETYRAAAGAREPEPRGCGVL